MEKEKIILGNCYYHAGKFAVTTCTNCGVSICKECAVKDFDKNIICVQCGNRMLKEDHKAFRKEVKDRGGMFSEGVEFIIPSIVGIILAVAFIVTTMNVDAFKPLYSEDTKTIIAVCAAYFVLFFGLPYGYVALRELFADRFVSFGAIIGIWWLKVMVSMFFGWLFFLFFIIRFIIRRIRDR